jgi:hypothetical protein
MAVEPR